MPKKFSLGLVPCVICLMVVISSAGCATWGGSAAKRMSREISRVWDFGTIKEGAQAQHTFLLANEGKKPLSIISVNTSCGCTVSDVEKRLLEPGESTQVTVAFDSKGYSGEIRQYIYIGTDDPKDPLIKFVITAEVT